MRFAILHKSTHSFPPKAGHWPVVITMGCTAGSLTACRLRTSCYVIFISYLFSCITFHFRQVMQPPHTFTLFHSPAVAALRCCYNPLRASHYVIELCLEKSNQQYFFKSSIRGRMYSQPVSSGF